MRRVLLVLPCVVLSACGTPNHAEARSHPAPAPNKVSQTPNPAPAPKPTQDSLSLDKNILTRAKNATVLIGDFENGRLTMSGSGVVSEDGLTIFTNRHVVVGTDDQVDPLKIVFFSGTDHPKLVQVDASDVRVFDGPAPDPDHYHEKDVAAIKLKSKVTEPLKLGKSETEEETQPAWAFGFPLGTKIRMDSDLPSPTVHSMRIERLEKEGGAVRVIQLGGSPTHGDSGGPVIDAEGEVIGLMQAKETEASIVYAVPTKTIRDLLDASKASKLVASEWSKPIEPKESALMPKADSRERPFSWGVSSLSRSPVSESDLARLTPKELTILRNEPFARRGYIFKRGDLAAVFRKMDWYVPRTHDLAAIQASLSKTESRNVAFIRAYQDATGKRW